MGFTQWVLVRTAIKSLRVFDIADCRRETKLTIFERQLRKKHYEGLRIALNFSQVFGVRGNGLFALFSA